ncbi:hypothetical protein SYNPS1DRAFT_26413 [Syncephalis pseudoplumigaleata]|uniref:Uncharacterized protein n=1 Tax=Syncephalis pseudoplumigaleata TaxID=1712513 RepID=A0A4P9Z5R0_9FUNG|nr:hypothetical protein SYNPS1DRAFT_26413 [Syncephalis pseudoplumigaleata]|eukprot:RKP27967.1 hypothetical protein SYNPS1DRAFT_26413 [Syncephalis pseudoplumigaleata]
MEWRRKTAPNDNAVLAAHHSAALMDKDHVHARTCQVVMVTSPAVALRHPIAQCARRDRAIHIKPYELWRGHRSSSTTLFDPLRRNCTVATSIVAIFIHAQASTGTSFCRAHSTAGLWHPVRRIHRRWHRSMAVPPSYPAIATAAATPQVKTANG